MSARAARERVAQALMAGPARLVPHPATLDPVETPTAYVGLAVFDDGTATGCAALWRVTVIVSAGDPTAAPEVWDALDDTADALADRLRAAGIHVTRNAPETLGDRFAVREIETETYA